jgi:hypothetical protein
LIRKVATDQLADQPGRIGQPWIAAIRHPLAPIVIVAIAVVADITLFVRHHPGGDVSLYQQYASNFWFGSPPFHELPAEYPPLALVIFTLTLIPPIQDYTIVFAIWMGALFGLGLWTIHRFEGRGAAVSAGVYIALGGLGTVLTRFDLVPSLAVLAALWLAYRQRWGAAASLIAVGFLLKLYPIILLPLLVIEQRRTQGRFSWRPLVTFVSIAGSGMLIAAALAPASWWSPFSYALRRPPQVESVEASLLWLTSGLGVAAHADQSFHSANIVGGLATPLSTLESATFVIGIGWIYLRHLQGRLSLHRATLACLLITLLASKVFSPQYLIWVLPLVAIVEGLTWRWVLICVLTSVIYPVLYMSKLLYLGSTGPGSYGFLFAGTIALRNALLVYAFVMLVRTRDSSVRIITPTVPGALKMERTRLLGSGTPSRSRRAGRPPYPAPRRPDPN